MFHRFSLISNINVSGFETVLVVSMSYMFYGYQGLKKLDKESLKQGNVLLSWECLINVKN